MITLCKNKCTIPGNFRYIGGLSANPREEHLRWSGTVLPADGPWRRTHWPPNGWGCKCEAVSVSRREMERDGLKVSRRPADGTYEWANPQTGEIFDVPRGIDPGWDYNPGMSAWGQSLSEADMEKMRMGPSLPLQRGGRQAPAMGAAAQPMSHDLILTHPGGFVNWQA